jgi:hypothetical protein
MLRFLTSHLVGGTAIACELSASGFLSGIMAEAAGASGGGEKGKLTRAGICEGHCVIAYVYIGKRIRI